MSQELMGQEWYSALVEECKAIITEAVFTSRWALVEGYHALGNRIVTEGNLDRKGIYAKKIMQGLAISIGQSTRTIYYAIQFYEKFPELDKLPGGKNMTWNKVIALLPDGKHQEKPQWEQNLRRAGELLEAVAADERAPADARATARRMLGAG